MITHSNLNTLHIVHHLCIHYSKYFVPWNWTIWTSAMKINEMHGQKHYRATDNNEELEVLYSDLPKAMYGKQTQALDKVFVRTRPYEKKEKNLWAFSLILWIATSDNKIEAKIRNKIGVYKNQIQTHQDFDRKIQLIDPTIYQIRIQKH